MNAPMLTPLVGLVVGILAAMIGAGLWAALAVALAGCAVWILMQHLSRNPARSFRLNKWNYSWVLLVFCSVGIFTTDLNRPFLFEDDSESRSSFRIGDIVAVTGRIDAIKHSTSGDIAEMQIFNLIDSVGNAFSVNNMKILVRSDAMSCDIDDNILATAPLQPIVENANRFDQSYVKHLHQQGIYYQTQIEGADIEIIGHNSTLVGVGSSIRSRLESAIEHTSLSKSTQSFLITVLLGDRAYLSADRRELFADAGISHILALSGMHVAIIAGILMWLLFPLNFAGLYRWRLVVTSLLLFFYALITGLAPSIVRATLMSAAMLVALLLERKNSGWNSLLLAMFVILLFDPFALFDIGLQLSFLCVASLIFFVNPLNPIDHRSHPVSYRVAAFLLTSIVATLATWCVTAYYFGMIPLAFLPANILALPLLPLFITLSIIYLLLAAVGFEPIWLGHMLDWSLDSLHHALCWLTGNGSSSIDFSPSVWAVWCWLLLLVLAAILISGHRKKLIKWAFAFSVLLFGGVTTADAYREEPDSMIIKNSFRDISLLRRIGDNEEQVILPRHTLSVSFPLDGVSIVTLDALPDSASIAKVQIAIGDSCDYLLIAAGYKGTLEYATQQIPARKIILHSSMRKKRERLLMHEADSLSLPIHSLRQNGPLRH